MGMIFLALRVGQKKTEQLSEVLMSLLVLVGCSVVTLDSLGHVRWGCVFHDVCVCVCVCAPGVIF